MLEKDVPETTRGSDPFPARAACVMPGSRNAEQQLTIADEELLLFLGHGAYVRRFEAKTFADFLPNNFFLGPRVISNISFPKIK